MDGAFEQADASRRRERISSILYMWNGVKVERGKQTHSESFAFPQPITFHHVRSKKGDSDFDLLQIIF